MIDLGEIGVKMSLSGNVTAVLAKWVKDLGIFKTAVGEAGTAMKVLKFAAAGLVLGGAILLDMLHLTKLGDKYIAQLEEMKNKNLTAPQIAEAEKISRTVASSVPQSTLVGNIKDWNDLLQVFGDSKDATKYLELAEKAKAMLSAGLVAQGHSAEGARDDVFNMVKALEMMGKSLNPREFAANLDLMLKTAQASKYRVTGHDFMMQAAQAKTAASSFSPEFMMTRLTTYGQEIGSASKAGTASMSLYASLVGGAMLAKSKALMASYGLMDASGAVRGRALAAKDPYEWTQQMLLPALRAHGVVTQEAIRVAIAKLFPNRTAGALVTSMATQQSKYDKDKVQIDNSAGLTRYEAEARANPIMVRDAVSAQWERIQTDLGKMISPTVTAALYQFAMGLKTIAETLEAHPEATRIAMEIAAGLAGLMIVLGGVALGIAAFGVICSPAVLAIGGIVIALGALGVGLYYAWDYLKGPAMAVVNWLRTTLPALFVAAWTVFKHALSIGWEWLKQVPPLISTAWRGFMAALSAGWEWLRQIAGPLVTTAWQAIKAPFISAATWLRTEIPALITSAWSSVKTAIISSIDGITAAFATLIARLKAAIRGFLDTITGGLLNPSGSPPPSGVAPDFTTPHYYRRGTPPADHPDVPHNSRPGPHRTSWNMPTPPAAAARTVAMNTINLHVDGKVVSSVVLAQLASGLTRQVGGTTSSDDRLTPRPFAGSYAVG